MADIETTQKKIENKLFDFIEENFGKKRYECFNEVVNFVEDKLIPTLSHCDEDLEDSVVELQNAFNSSKEDCCDRLEGIESELENIIKSIELDSVMDKKLKELKKVVENQHKIIANSNDF